MPHPASQPPLPSWGLFLGAIERRLRSAGAEPNLGLQLPAALAAAGLADVTYEARAPLMHTGTPSIDFVVLTFEQLGPRLVEAGLLTAAELEVGLAALRAPGHTMTAALLVAASGRKEVPGA